MEFGHDKTTIAKRLKAASQEPDDDGTFTTAQVIAALFGDKEAAQTRKIAAEAEMKEGQLSLQQGRSLPTEDVFNFISSVLVTFRQRVSQDPDIPEPVKLGLLAELEKALSNGEATKRLLHKS